MRLNLLVFVLIASNFHSSTYADKVDFNRDIRPIFAANCYACHGPDEQAREADLRLDDRASAVESGAITPAHLADSELLARIESDDPEIQMPPPESNKRLDSSQRKLLRDWIEQGARYDRHWAFVPPKRPEVPEHDKELVANPIDAFVLERLKSSGLILSPAADRYTLIRRVYLDLLGLPPTIEQADVFAQDDSPGAYENLVDQLFQSPQYGERWARPWLDLARYSDTNGYEKDRERSIWPYRDWVIRALNADMPYDQFSIEQLAGDMLPNPTLEQLTATGFHRNTMLNEEGGIDPLEYRFYAVVDRVATTGTVWLGLTTGCAQCHTHKYDPITHEDYYRFFALLNNADEPDLLLKDAANRKKEQEIQNQIDELTAKLPEQFPPADGDQPIEQRRAANIKAKFQIWFEGQRKAANHWQILRPTKMDSNLPRLELLDDGSIFSTGDVTKRDVYRLEFVLSDADVTRPITALRLEAIPDDRLPAGGPGRAYYEGRKGDFFLSELSAEFDGNKLRLKNPSRSYGKIAVGSGNGDAKNVLDGDGSTGWSTAKREGESHQLVVNLAEPITTPGRLVIEMLFERHFVAALGRFRLSATSSESDSKAKSIPVDIEQQLSQPKLIDSDISRLQQYYLTVAEELQAPNKKIAQLRKHLNQVPSTMVMQERPTDNPRPTHRHHRGEYLSPREQVTPGVPAFLADTSHSGDSAAKRDVANRLELARWLVSPENPLAARVAVNRAWQEFFGRGLLKTSGDFGTQSPAPSHPELLDWLACEFVDRDWSMKQLHRTIVLSKTYQQSAKATPEKASADPENILLSHFPRHRVSGEGVRDIMLHASGLLSNKMYGPSVRPPQPESVVKVAYGSPGWPASNGEDRYRRSLYTFSKRTAPFAAYVLFDAPSGENCTARRDRSNTPLQALTLLNDKMYLEMAEALAARSTKEQSTDEAVATLIFRRLLTRPPQSNELKSILAFFTAQKTRLANGQLDAKKIVGESSNELAAWTMTTRALMNLDEVITKP